MKSLEKYSRLGLVINYMLNSYLHDQKTLEIPLVTRGECYLSETKPQGIFIHKFLTFFNLDISFDYFSIIIELVSLGITLGIFISIQNTHLIDDYRTTITIVT